MKKNYLFLILFFAANLNIFSQTIDRSKKELGANKSNKSSSSRSSTASNIADLDPDFIILVLRIFGYATYGVLIGDYANEDHLKNNLSDYPFSTNNCGNYLENQTIQQPNFRLDLESKFISLGNSFKGNHLDIKLRPSKYFYLTSDWYQLYEYNTFTKKNDALSLYYFNFAYDRVRFENFNLGWTMGASYVGNEVQKGGFSSGLNAEYFFNNIGLSADMKWSSINQNPVNSYEFQAKYFKKNYFATVSYERLKIGTPVYNLIGIGAGIYF